jgi:hypothetical protein
MGFSLIFTFYFFFRRFSFGRPALTLDPTDVQDEIGLKEWLTSLKTAHKCSLELLANMARKAGKIYGTDLDSNNRHHNSPVASRSANGN